MNILENLKSRALKQAFFIRSGVYFAESLPLQFLENYVVRGEIGLQKVPIDERILVEDVKSLIEKDAENISKGLYPISVLELERPVGHVKNLVKIYLDSINVFLNKKYNRHKEFNKENRRKTEEVPKYYRRNFHNQTYRWLSIKKFS